MLNSGQVKDEDARGMSLQLGVYWMSPINNSKQNVFYMGAHPHDLLVIVQTGRESFQ